MVRPSKVDTDLPALRSRQPGCSPREGALASMHHSIRTKEAHVYWVRGIVRRSRMRRRDRAPVHAEAHAGDVDACRSHLAARPCRRRVRPARTPPPRHRHAPLGRRGPAREGRRLGAQVIVVRDGRAARNASSCCRARLMRRCTPARRGAPPLARRSCARARRRVPAARAGSQAPARRRRQRDRRCVRSCRRSRPRRHRRPSR